MNLPAISDRFKRSIIAETAMRLAAAHGRRKMYSAAEIQAAMAAANFPAAWAGWTVSVFCTGPEFDDYCAKHGVTADYAATRSEMLKFLDKPLVTPAMAAGAVVAAVGAGAGAQALAASVDLAAEVADLADDASDVVGGLFDVLQIFD
jgi:hypothetical protein